MRKVETNMSMSFEELTPEIAANLLESNENNRNLSKSLVMVYAKDILDGNWDENVGVAISIDENGVLRDGQHRCAAVVEAGKSINVWVCRNVAEDGMYDNNRKRSQSDQMMIMRPDIDAVFRSSRAVSVIRTLIEHKNFKGTHSAVSSKQVIDYIDANKSDLEVFFKSMPTSTVAKISLSGVYLSLYLAYLGGVDIEVITDYYAILSDGMSSSEFEYPIIAYRNYLLGASNRNFTDGDIARCQYSLKKYLAKACTKRSIEPKEIIWKFPQTNPI